MWLQAYSTFGGGISNSGTISGVGNGGFVGGQLSTSSTLTISMGTFAGGNTNTGVISASGSGFEFLGGVGIFVGAQPKAASYRDVATALGGIVNGGTISAEGGGVFGGNGIIVGAQVLSGGSGPYPTFPAALPTAARSGARGRHRCRRASY